MIFPLSLQCKAIYLTCQDKQTKQLIVDTNSDHGNLKNDERTNIFTYLETKGYALFHEPVSTLALK